MGEVIEFLPFKLAQRMAETEFVRVIPENGDPIQEIPMDEVDRHFAEMPSDCPA